MKRIFISYRRADSQESTGRIYDHLAGRFGKNRVFADVDSIPIGADFVEKIDTAIRQSHVVLVIIGPKWSSIRNPDGQRRLNDPQDIVRIELETAFEQDRRVIPVLVQNATMPNATDLPASLAPLASLNAAQVRSGRDFKNDNEELSRLVDPDRAKRRYLFGGAGVAFLLMCLVLFRVLFLESSDEEPAAQNEMKTSAEENPKASPQPIVETKPDGPPPPIRDSSVGVPMSIYPNAAMLNRVLTKEDTVFEMIDFPLSDAVFFLSDLHAVPIRIDEVALANEGIALDEPFTKNVRGVTFHAGLFTVLKPLGLTYLINDAGILITTESAAAKVTQTRFYEVGDLTARGLISSNLTRVIQENTSPVWNDRTRARISDSIQNTLVVTAPVIVHDEIEGFLIGLRNSKR